MTEKFKLTLIWIVATVAALVVGLAPVSAAFVDGHYIPSGPDSFYHARRILDAVANPAGFYQFDHLMHVPEGSLIIWPWAYDWVMSLLVRLGLALHVSRDPMAILDNLPVLAFALAVGLMLLICRQLQLSLRATAFALLATAFFPLNQALYGVGNIDHHYAEHLFVLASLGCGLAWLGKPDSTGRACAAGAILGLAPGVHTALFILQLPLVLGFAWLWMRNLPRPRNTIVFAVALIFATLAVALPSLPLREGQFEFYTLSWFQVYFAACVAIICVLLGHLPFSRRNIGLLAAAAMVMAIPVVGQMLFAERFFSNAVAGMDEISEVQSPWRMTRNPGGVWDVANWYTVLIFLAPLTAVLSAWRLWRATEPDRVFFWVASLFGLALLLQQLRMNYFGSFALYLPWIFVIDERARRWPAKATASLALLGAALALAYAPGVTHNLFARHNSGADKYYQVTRKIYRTFAEECERNPGVALADPFDGHYIRFHTRCAVIANPFLLTPLHERKLLEERRLLSLPAAQLLQNAPYLRYVYVRRTDLFYIGPNNSTVITPRGNASDPDLPLVEELLSVKPDQLPRHFRLVKELYFPSYEDTPYARLFALDGE